MITFVHYHRISPRIFKEHVDFYKKNYSISDLEDLAYGKGLGNKPLFITFDDGWGSDYDHLSVFHNLPSPATIFLSMDLIRDTRIETLTLTQIDEMREAVNFQSHGLSHRDLTVLPLEAARREISESRRLIAEMTGKNVYAYAYPFNKNTPELVREVREAGYRLARTGDRMLNRADCDLFTLKSVGVPENCTVKELRYRLFRAWVKTFLREP